MKRWSIHVTGKDTTKQTSKETGEKDDMAEIEQIKRKQSNDKIFTLLGHQAALIGS